MDTAKPDKRLGNLNTPPEDDSIRAPDSPDAWAVVRLTTDRPTRGIGRRIPSRRDRVLDLESAAQKGREAVHRSVEPALLTVPQLADYLSVSQSWIYAKVEADELPYVRIGRYVRFALHAIAAYLDAQRRGPGGLK